MAAARSGFDKPPFSRIDIGKSTCHKASIITNHLRKLVELCIVAAVVDKRHLYPGESEIRQFGSEPKGVNGGELFSSGLFYQHPPAWKPASPRTDLAAILSHRFEVDHEGLNIDVQVPPARFKYYPETRVFDLRSFLGGCHSV